MRASCNFKRVEHTIKAIRQVEAPFVGATFLDCRVITMGANLLQECV